MSQNLELNKIFAAILVAGVTAMMAGFIAKKLVHSNELEKDAVFIDGGAVAAGGVIKVAMPDPIAHLIATGDIAKGQKLSKACAACHSFDKGGSAKVGPNLWNIVNRKKGQAADFSSSDAMIEHGGSWDYVELNQFLWKPKSLIPGTKMNYIGLKKAQDRASIIAWLRTRSDNAASLPSASQIDAEKAKFAPEVEEEGAVTDSVEEVLETDLTPVSE